MLKIRIGHPAYTGTNALAFAFTKSQAVEILRDRGAKRDEARATVDLALLGRGYVCLSVEHQVIEVNVVENPMTDEDKVAKERDIINRNPELALNLIDQHRRVYKVGAPHRRDLARNILLVKQGVRLAPPPREVVINKEADHA